MFLSMLIYQRKEHNVLVFSSSNFAEKDCCLSAADLYSSQFFDKKHGTIKKQRDLFLVVDQWRNVHIAVLPMCLGIHLGRILKKYFIVFNLQDTLRHVLKESGCWEQGMKMQDTTATQRRYIVQHVMATDLYFASREKVILTEAYARLQQMRHENLN